MRAQQEPQHKDEPSKSPKENPISRNRPRYEPDKEAIRLLQESKQALLKGQQEHLQQAPAVPSQQSPRTFKEESSQELMNRRAERLGKMGKDLLVVPAEDANEDGTQEHFLDPSRRQQQARPKKKDEDEDDGGDSHESPGPPSPQHSNSQENGSNKGMGYRSDTQSDKSTGTSTM